VRLTQIKLAGFKSFVDPTVIPTPSDLVGVVGPNGCGKSNIIDAVRWVLGETRASELRGASMQDVIFNGSELRKPAARASVELVFDNSLGRALGPWSPFAEISVRRVLARDGTSSYYINQQGVRRRDVHDLFLGTGLGSRGYAIIGQGMIHRLIEARPEELRVTLEEAAGVSRYKERRRETEHRLADARENLLRLEDILGELASGLEKLQKQARAAERFRSLQAEMHLKQHMSWWLGAQAAKARQARLAAEYEQAQAALESDQSRLRALEARLEVLRQVHFEANEALHRVQGQLFEAGARVSRHEAEARHRSETRARLQARQRRLQGRLSDWQGQQRASQQALAGLEADLQGAQVQAQDSAEALRRVQQGLPELEAQSSAHEQELAAAGRAVARLEQDIALAQQASRQAEALHTQAQKRQERLLAEQAAHAPAVESGLPELAQACADAEAASQSAQARLQALEAEHMALAAQRDQAREDTQVARQTLARLEARHQALTSLQQRPVGEALNIWLEAHGLQDQPVLWQRLRVEPDWQIALEAVLGERLQAHEAADLGAVRDGLQNLPPVGLTLYQGVRPPQGARPLNDAGPVAPGRPRRLLDHIHAADPALDGVLQAWLGHVWVAADLDEALAQRARLAPGCCWIVPAGHRVHACSIQMHAPDPQRDGWLARQDEIEDLHEAVLAAHMQLEQAEDQAERAGHACVLSEQALQACRQDGAACTQAWHELRLRHAQQQDEHAHAQAMARRIQADLLGVQSLLHEQQAQRAEADLQCATLQADHARQHAALLALQQRRAQLAQALEARQQEVRAHENRAREAEWVVRTARQQFEEQQRTIDWAQEQYAQSLVELEDTQGELFELDETEVDKALQQALADRVDSEVAVQQSRQALEQAAHDLRQADEARLVLERGLEPLRGQLTALQLDEQAARLAAEQCAGQLAAAGAEQHVLQQAREQHAAEPGWQDPAWLQTEVQRVSGLIQSLGAVNLAAVEELAALQERKGFLEAQHQDVQTAIDTLENAIRRIDQETRAQLADTFEQVNAHFGRLFPQLFGGGQARLIMTGEEILDSGVQVMAQPPGKRNTSIHLLSGGEKALTAIALVFALFRLNPAPFCLLDEVDAPLDDANTQRYAELVRSMSTQTQFLFISHNKIAMQMARQLIGVTMQEQGVSRIVAVDMEAALQWATSQA